MAYADELKSLHVHDVRCVAFVVGDMKGDDMLWDGEKWLWLDEGMWDGEGIMWRLYQLESLVFSLFFCTIIKKYILIVLFVFYLKMQCNGKIYAFFLYFILFCILNLKIWWCKIVPQNKMIQGCYEWMKI